MQPKIPKITITGTKGKTTVSYIVADVLKALGKNVLRVDTTGHFINGKQKSTLQDAKDTWGLVPTVSPGKYLFEFLVHPELKENGVAVLEAALGSSGSPGLGYRAHAVGVFLNVFEDHLGTTQRLQTKADIALAKQFVFKQLDRDGYAVFNADDNLVVDRLQVVPKELDVNLIPCGIEFSEYDIVSLLSQGGKAFTIKEGTVVLLEKDTEQALFDLKVIPWTFDATFGPSNKNLMFAAAALYAYNGGEWDQSYGKAFEAVRLDPYGGRLTVLQAANGTKILADYAHEKVSLREVADLGKRMSPNGKVIGVTRLAHDRTDDHLSSTGKVIGESFDVNVIYEKIDGYYRKPRPSRGWNYPEVVGRTSEIVAAAASEVNKNVTRIMREDEALAYAASVAKPEDVVVVIVNDDIKRSIDFIKDAFKAELV